MPSREPLYLIDAIGPFFRAHPKRTINWSKIPFQYLSVEGEEGGRQWAQIRADLDRFCENAAAMGFNAVSLDDVTHLARHVCYSSATLSRIELWRGEFRQCFEIIRKHGLRIFLTMDVLSTTPEVRERLKGERFGVERFLEELLEQFFEEFTEISGVIIRIGESDADDVRDDFRSQLYLKSARQVNAFLHRMLPLFERYCRVLVLRTWTVGAYGIGDLMWHRGTFRRVFSGVEDNKALVVSMKYGESDFFRYLPLNPNFFESKVAKIIELQTRREYEGCGEYPSFTGWDYAQYARQLRTAENIVGFMVWCQTGGWVPFRRLALLDPEAVWTDLNTFVTVRIFRDQQTVEAAVREFAKTRGFPNEEALLQLLKLSDEVIRGVLYVDEFSRQSLFFRRVRIPPILHVYWHNIFVSHSVRKVLHYFVSDPEASLTEASEALSKLEEMKVLAEQCGMPVNDIEFMEDTFRVLALAREYYFSPLNAEIEERIRVAKGEYKLKYPKSGPRYRYRIKVDFQPFWMKAGYMALGFQLFMRKEPGYRLIDRLITLRGLALVYRLVAKRRPYWIPRFAKDSAMGVDAIFR